MSIFMIISILGGFIVFVATWVIYEFFWRKALIRDNTPAKDINYFMRDEMPNATSLGTLMALSAFTLLFFGSIFVATEMEHSAVNDWTEKEVLLREYNVVKTGDKAKINIDKNKAVSFYFKDENGAIELKEIPLDEFASIVESDENEVIVGEYVIKVTGKRCDVIHGCRIETWDKFLHPNISRSPKVAHRFKIHVPKNMLDDFI